MRLDQALVVRGLSRSRATAAEVLREGRVRVDGQPVRKPSTQVRDDQGVEVEGESELWVGRAAYKLLAVLAAYPIDVKGARCIDVGASTGGFTQVLLAAQAAEVVALDVGRGQLAPLVAGDPRVVEMSGQSVRGLAPEAVGGVADIVVADLSFISLRLVLDTLAALTSAQGHLVTLIKPQFEIGKERLGRTGVVGSAQQRHEVLAAVQDSARSFGLHVHGLLHSPVVGGTGNTEYLMWCRHRAEGKMSDVSIQEFMDAVADGRL